MTKAVIYVRVSSKEQKQEGYSIPAQKKLLADFSKAKGFKIAKEFEDDETAKSAGRTGFGQMVEYLKNNTEINTILVEKTDRLYRNFRDYVIIEDLGATVYLVKESEVIGKNASSHQKFIHGIKVLMAKNYIDNLSEGIRKGYNQKAEDGIYPSSTLPIGYKLGKDGDKTVPLVDEEKLSHSKLLNKKAQFTYKKPFNRIAERVSSSDWWSWRELHPRPKVMKSNLYKLSKS